MGFSEKIIASSSEPIHFLHGQIGFGIQRYWFIMCSTNKYKILASKFGKEPVNLEEYGVIVASGYGHRPTDAVKKKLKEDYNFDADKLLN